MIVDVSSANIDDKIPGKIQMQPLTLHNHIIT